MCCLAAASCLRCVIGCVGSRNAVTRKRAESRLVIAEAACTRESIQGNIHKRGRVAGDQFQEPIGVVGRIDETAP
jgi:hypothetical protein